MYQMSLPVLCIGEALIDMICTDREVPLSEGEHFIRKAGGAPTNVAAAIAALGGKVDLATRVGIDPFGQHLVDLLSSFGVNTKWIIRDPLQFTTFAFVSLMANGERDFYFNRGADALLSQTDLVGLHLDNYGIVHFGSATAFLPGPLRDTYFNLLDECRKQQRYISFDPNYRQLLFGERREEFVRLSWQFLDHCHFCKMSEEEALMITRCGDVEEAARQIMNRSSAVLAITLGAKGALLGWEKELYPIAPVPVSPVDSTGAGDAFVGAILFQLQNLAVAKPGLADWKRMMLNANRAGARTCEQMGAMEAFRQLNQEILQ